MDRPIMYQAIVARFKGHSDTRRARIIASAEAGSVTVEWNDNFEPERNYCVAAKTYAVKHGFDGAWAGGALPNNAGYVFVRLPDGTPFTCHNSLIGFTIRTG